MKTKYPKLPRKFKKKWIEALRSGEYPQGKFSLRGHDGYCCLGVACKIAGNDISQDDGYIDKKYINVPSILIGENGLVVSTLSDMNDSGKSFKYIADWIEKNL